MKNFLTELVMNIEFIRIYKTFCAFDFYQILQQIFERQWFRKESFNKESFEEMGL